MAQSRATTTTRIRISLKRITPKSPSPDQVQIYEDIMVGANNIPTTGLLTAVRFIKDNRLLPRGFDKRAVEQEIAPQGEAVTDANFIGGERQDPLLQSRVGDAQGPFQVEAELWFQPISYRWAINLKSYNAMEPQRFTRYYDSMASGSGLMLDRASARDNQISRLDATGFLR